MQHDPLVRDTEGETDDAGVAELQRVTSDSGGPVLRFLRGMVVVAYVFVAAGLFWPLFSLGDNGYGDVVYLALSRRATYLPAVAAVTVIVLLLSILLDVDYWPPGGMRVLALLIKLFLYVMLLITALCASTLILAAPLTVYFIVTPLILYAIKSYVLCGMSNLALLWWSAGALLIVAVCSFIGWALWVVQGGNFWDTDLQMDYYIRLQCVNASAFANDSDAAAVLADVDKNDTCEYAHIAWLCMLFLGAWSLLVSALLFFTVRAHVRFKQGGTKMDPAAQIFLTVIMVCLFGMLSASQIGADPRLTRVVFVFSCLTLLVACAAVVLLSGTARLSREVTSMPLVQKIAEYTHTDTARALIMLCFGPILLVLVPFSALRQLGRRKLAFTKRLSEDEVRLWLTPEVGRLLLRIRRWHLTNVLNRTIQWGIALFSLSVIVARVFNVFFSWLNQVFVDSGTNVWVVSTIFFAVCWFLIMLPPTPGLPLFLASSLILIPVGVRDGYDFWSMWLWATFVAVFIKETGLFGGQVLGRLWGAQSVTIRRLVGVNSMEMRAVKHILLEKGVSMGKVGILLGGPDWPTAVVAGILKTSYVQNIIGTLPIVVMILPITISGAFIIKTSEGGVWASAEVVALSVAVFTQMGSMLMAVLAIEATIRSHRDELEAYPLDIEVSQLDDASSRRSRARRYASRWQFLPTWLKVVLIAGTTTETASVYIFQLLGSYCFVEFAITDSIGDTLGGNALNLVKPFGWAAMAMCGFGVVVEVVLARWIDWKVRSLGGKDFIAPDARRLANDVDDEDADATRVEMSPLASPAVKASAAASSSSSSSSSSRGMQSSAVDVI